MGIPVGHRHRSSQVAPEAPWSSPAQDEVSIAVLIDLPREASLDQDPQQPILAGGPQFLPHLPMFCPLLQLIHLLTPLSACMAATTQNLPTRKCFSQSSRSSSVTHQPVRSAGDWLQWPQHREGLGSSKHMRFLWCSQGTPQWPAPGTASSVKTWLS